MQLRVCFVEGKFNMFGADYDDQGFAHRITGEWADLVDQLLGHQLLSRYNISFKYFPVKEVTDAKGYQSYPCIDAVSKDLADVSHNMAAYPVIADNVEQAAPRMQYETSFMSSYQPYQFTKSPDMMQFLTSFTPSFTSLLIVSVVLITGLTWLSFRRKRKRKRPKEERLPHLIWSILTFNFDPFAGVKLLLLMLLLVVSAYKCYAGSVMNTELVVGIVSDKLDSLAALLREKVPFTFMNAWEIEIFESSKSPEIRDMMRLSKKRGIKQLLIRMSNLTQVAQFNRDLANQKHAPIFYDHVPPEKIICAMSAMLGIDMSGRQFLRTWLDQVPRHLTGVIVNKKLSERNATIAKLLHRAIRITEADSHLALVTSRKKVDEVANAKIASFKSAAEECMRNFDRQELSSTVFKPGLENFKILTAACTTLLLVSLMMLGSEMYSRR